MARAVLCWKPLLCWKDYRVVSRSFRGKGWVGWVGSAQELFRQGVPVDSLSAASPLPIPRSRRDPLCSRPEPPPGKSAVGVPPPSRHTTTHSPPFRSSLLAAIETSLPGPGPRRAAVAIQSPFPGSPEPAPGSGLVLFWTLRGTGLWWRSLEPTGNGVCHSPVGQICCSSRLAEP